VFFKTSKNFVNNLPMFLKSGAPNQDVIQIDCVVEHGVYPVFYSDFPLFLLLLLHPLEAFLAFAQSKRPSQCLTMCALLFFFLTPIRCPGIPVVHQLL
jgi:hypothetical protein